MTAALKDTTPPTDDTIRQTLSQGIETLREDVSSLTTLISDAGSEKGQAAVEAATQKVTAACDVVLDQAETARLHAMEAQDVVTDFVRERPMTAVGIAAGLGFAIGMLSARR